MAEAENVEKGIMKLAINDKKEEFFLSLSDIFSSANSAQSFGSIRDFSPFFAI